MSWYLFRNILNFILASILGLLVFYKNPRNKANILYMLLCLAIAYWDFVDFNIYFAKSYEAAKFWANLDFAASVLGIGFLTHFMIEFSQFKRLAKSKVIWLIIYLPITFFSLYDLFTHRLSGDIVGDVNGWDISRSSDRVTYLSWIWVFTMAILGIYSFFKFFQKGTDPTLKKQAKVILFGFLFSFFSSAVEGVTWITDITIPPVFIFGVTVECAVIGYAMLRYELFTLNPVTAAESIITTMSDNLLLISSDKRIMGVNDSMLGLTGYKRDELLGENVNKLLINEKVDEEEQKILTLIFKKDNLTDVEASLITKDRIRVPLSLSTSLVKRKINSKGEREKILGIVCICRDIRDRKMIEKETELYKDKLKKLNREMIDRELEMIDLKQKIKILKSK